MDDQLRTNAPGIWALGGCNGKGGFTHTRRLSDRITAYALYIDPPLGRAGLTEAEERRSGKKALLGKRPRWRRAKR